jgi:molecular chaperone GrpE
MESTKSEENRPADGITPEGAAMDAGLRVAELETQLRSVRDESLRQLAEMDNVRKRLQRDIDAARKYGTEKLIGDLLPVADGLDAGLKAGGTDAVKLREGMDMTLALLHQAVSMVASPKHKPGTVVTVFQKGYVLADRLLRPALVAVASEPSPPEDVA